MAVYTDDLGWVNPAADKFDLDKKRPEYWLKVGAQATPTVHNLLVKADGFGQEIAGA